MFVNKLLNKQDIEALKSKEECKKMLGAYYPVLSLTREKNTNEKIHWRKEPYDYNGEILYLSFEWFEEQYDKLSEFLKSKIKK